VAVTKGKTGTYYIGTAPSQDARGPRSASCEGNGQFSLNGKPLEANSEHRDRNAGTGPLEVTECCATHGRGRRHEGRGSRARARVFEGLARRIKAMLAPRPRSGETRFGITPRHPLPQEDVKACQAPRRTPPLARGFARPSGRPTWKRRCGQRLTHPRRSYEGTPRNSRRCARKSFQSRSVTRFDPSEQTRGGPQWREFRGVSVFNPNGPSDGAKPHSSDGVAVPFGAADGYTPQSR